MQKNQLKFTILIVALAAILGGWLSTIVFNLNRSPSALQTATIFSAPQPVIDFNLVDAHGKAFTKERLKDHWSILFFGYTSCPDVCPTTLNQLGSIWKTLSEEQRSTLQIVFVSVDPHRDTTEKLASYTNYFNPEFIGVTGTDEQIRALTKSLGVPVIIVPASDGLSYTVDHSASLFLINPQQQFAGTISPPYKIEALTSDLKTLVTH